MDTVDVESRIRRRVDVPSGIELWMDPSQSCGSSLLWHLRLRTCPLHLPFLSFCCFSVFLLVIRNAGRVEWSHVSPYILYPPPFTFHNIPFMNLQWTVIIKYLFEPRRALEVTSLNTVLVRSVVWTARLDVSVAIVLNNWSMSTSRTNNNFEYSKTLNYTASVRFIGR